MKRLFLALALVSSNAFAEQVTVTGYGNTCDSALVNAKTLAVEKVTGTFVIGEASTDGKVYREDIATYNGGVLKGYDVLDTTISNGCHVRILADVDEKKNNRIVVQKLTNFATDYSEQDSRREVFSRLDDVSKAVYATMSNVRVSYKLGYAVVDADVTLGLQPKWVSDMKSFTGVIDDEGYMSNNAYSNAHGGLVSSLMGSNPFGALAIAMIGEPSKKPTRQDMMVCFDSSDCRSVGVDFARIPREPKLTIKGSGRILYEQYIDIKIYQFVEAGHKKNHPVFKSFNRQYNQPALLINSGTTQTIPITFNIEESLARTVKQLELFLR